MAVPRNASCCACWVNSRPHECPESHAAELEVGNDQATAASGMLGAAARKLPVLSYAHLQRSREAETGQPKAVETLH